MTGEVGTGKTTLCRSLLEQVPEGVDVAIILNPKLTALELVASVCDELGVSYPPETQSLKVLVDRLNLHLLEVHARGSRTVLIIDEAQNLSMDVLEQVRLLTNLETTTQKLLQIILIGQPELQALMAQPDLRQLAQRITARYHLTPLRRTETVEYIRHRLDVAGCHRPLFSAGAERLIHRLSGGVPRVINALCDRALLGAYASRKARVRKGLVRRAASEVLMKKPVKLRRRVLGWCVAALVLVLLSGAWHREGDRILQIIWPGTETVPLGPGQEGLDGGAAIPPEEEKDEPFLSGALEEYEVLADMPDPGTALPGPDGHSVGAWLYEVGSTDLGPAFDALFESWNIHDSGMPGADPCETAFLAGLRCLKGSGNWNTLRHLNRPAILELVDSVGERHYVAAMGLKDQGLILDVDGQHFSFSLSDLDPLWYGQFTILWKPPPHGTSPLRRGDRGPAIRWLQGMLDRAEGLTLPRSSGSLFQAELENRVMAFQKRHGLEADGIAGEQTFIQLNGAVGDPGIPRLDRGN